MSSILLDSILQARLAHGSACTKVSGDGMIGFFLTRPQRSRRPENQPCSTSCPTYSSWRKGLGGGASSQDDSLVNTFLIQTFILPRGLCTIQKSFFIIGLFFNCMKKIKSCKRKEKKKKLPCLKFEKGRLPAAGCQAAAVAAVVDGANEAACPAS